ncbi:galactose mutarotase-like enzyme [Mobilisporobacter senegalensis]|uniref:Galactose mutarotase-like enzyme n=1 Tax=Mobilisporobacter senegalensis TaxID=1329262 RepID=A0A3N1XPG2_9FIRM|nr:aldose 1-epimerase family protein [Mobilisporobacter senegalensis]ROR28563.1 galactose mutarotase-like enzyme [Mobilisporobacter senegalensis]
MIVSIKSKSATAAIDTLGAELKSFIDNSTGKDYIWCGDPKHWKGVSPLLFPMVGNLRNGKTMINGKEFQIPKHGIVRDKDFQILEQSDDSVVFSYSYTEDTLKVYPFRFNIRLGYRITGTTLTLSYDVYNLDDKDMYYHIGAHPGFHCPLFEGEKFSDYILQFEQKETCMSPVYDLEKLQFSNENRVCHLNHSDILNLSYDMFQQDAIVFDDIKSRKVSLINSVTKKGVSVDFHSFEAVAFWTPMNDTAPLLCIEPWNGAAVYSDEDNEFIHKRNIQTVKSGQKESYQLVIDLLV